MKPLEIEIINAGKRILRTNIVPHYLPIDESQITTREVPNFEGEGTHTETVYPEPIIDYWTWEENIEYVNCFALLTFGEYFDLNFKISVLEGFELSQPTERYATMNPVACKYNEQPDGSYEARLVMPIVAEVQEKCADLLTGLTLVDLAEITFAEEQPKVIEATGLTTEQVDWTLTHTAVTKPDLEVIYLLDSPPSPEAEQAIQQIVGNGTTVIVSDESK